ncbi:hypothetical protein FN846DRAFT_887946 [Sphaerosporella brunnea]|uniref:Uncharacterized protein n=1 Tax=Sphaerosporella brunnea TaxID=1250544 RepID=A0A5J5F461_9PEZI|nr:hypothetical protein FN846DRAFT_887946 [Sphaerosporella brunnea]
MKCSGSSYIDDTTRPPFVAAPPAPPPAPPPAFTILNLALAGGSPSKMGKTRAPLPRQVLNTSATRLTSKAGNVANSNMTGNNSTPPNASPAPRAMTLGIAGSPPSKMGKLRASSPATPSNSNAGICSPDKHSAEDGDRDRPPPPEAKRKMGRRHSASGDSIPLFAIPSAEGTLPGQSAMPTVFAGPLNAMGSPNTSQGLSSTPNPIAGAYFSANSCRSLARSAYHKMATMRYIQNQHNIAPPLGNAKVHLTMGEAAIVNGWFPDEHPGHGGDPARWARALVALANDAGLATLWLALFVGRPLQVVEGSVMFHILTQVVIVGTTTIRKRRWWPALFVGRPLQVVEGFVMFHILTQVVIVGTTTIRKRRWWPALFVGRPLQVVEGFVMFHILTQVVIVGTTTIRNRRWWPAVVPRDSGFGL